MIVSTICSLFLTFLVYSLGYWFGRIAEQSAPTRRGAIVAPFLDFWLVLFWILRGRRG